MNRRQFLGNIIGTGALLSLPGWLRAFDFHDFPLKLSDFGSDFHWGVATAAYQIEGAPTADGKGLSIWDTFTHKKGKIERHENGDKACDFYHLFESDLDIMKSMNIRVFRWSIAWSRIFPNGIGEVNPSGVAFYHRLIDACLARGIEPWVTMYHWDLPQTLQEQGGWTNRKSVEWFTQYADFITREFGSKVKYWMIMNEPMAFTGLGYLVGIHAPGKRGLGKFCASVHHTCLAIAEAAIVAKKNLPKEARIGSTYSCTYVQPLHDKPKNHKAVTRWDALMNRIFIEANLGMGYPIADVPVLKGIRKYIQPGDMEKLKTDLDFIGVQNYTRGLVRRALFPPMMWSREIPAKKRKVEMTDMKWEIYPEALYQMVKKFAAYPGVKEVIVTENGAAFPDILANGEVHDTKRLSYIQENIKQIHRAIQEGIPCKGYIIWSFMDNFEWTFGFRPRFGLVHVDFNTQKRTIKDSGKWFAHFLSEKK